MVSMSKIFSKKIGDVVLKEYPKYIGDWFRRNNPENQNYCRRHDFGENTEEGSDAAELIVNDQNWFQIATTVQQRDSLFNSSNWVLQVHIRTSPDASPENVGIFVGSDPTDSVTAPCKVEVLHLFRWYTHTHTSHIARFDFLEELRWRNW